MHRLTQKLNLSTIGPSSENILKSNKTKVFSIVMIFLAVFIGLATAYVATAITYYEILGVSRFASEDEIKKSYRKLAKDYHPDRVLPKNAVENGQKHLRLMQKVNLAYETLKDPTLRQEYNNKMNYYEVLGLHRTASEMEIKIAYLRMMRDFNLDLGTNDEEKNERLTVLSQIRMAHETLSDLHRRQDYDNSLPLEEIENDFWHNTSLFVYFRDINTIQQMVVAAVILILSIYYLALYLVPYLAHKYEIRNMRMNALQATRELLLHSPTVVGPEVKPTTSNTTSLPPSRVFAPSFKLQVRKESDVQTTKPESQTESLTEPTSAPTTQTSISATSAPPQQPFQLKLRPTTAKPASDVKKTTVPSSSQPRTTTRSSFLPPVTEQHSTTRPQWGTFTAASENERALIAQQNLEYELCVMEDLRKAEEARSARVSI